MEPVHNLFLEVLGGHLKTADRLKDVFDLKGGYYGFGIRAGLRTPLGPVQVSVSFCDKEDYDPVLQLEAGYTF